MDQIRSKQKDFQTPILPPAFEELWKYHRYKIFYGGRGGAKTLSFARALVAFAHKQRERILCTRQFQNSILESVHQTICDAIGVMGLQEYFRITDRSIRGVAMNSEFIFKGLKYAPREIKSTEGITKVWLAEAQSATEESLRALFPTIRARGSEIWAEFNTENDDDPFYKRFIINTHPDAYVRLVNYDENPYFNPDPANPSELEKERLYSLGLISSALDADGRAQAQADYDNIWLGAIRAQKAAAIFAGKVVVEDFTAPEGAVFYHGADWGFAKDPTCLTRWHIGNWKGKRALFLDYESFGYGTDIENIPALFDKIPTARKWKIYGDNARPETISYIKRKGFNIEAAEKWPGSIEDGLEFMRGFEIIVMHPRCKHTIRESKYYCYKVDPKTNEILPDIVDAHNHGFDSGRYALWRLIKKKPVGFFDTGKVLT